MRINEWIRSIDGVGINRKIVLRRPQVAIRRNTRRVEDTEAPGQIEMFTLEHCST